MRRAIGIALGSNLGNRAETMQRAVRQLVTALAVPGTKLAIAPLFRSAPVDCPEDSPEFLNSAIELISVLPILEILHRSQAIERQLGRARGDIRNAPRTIDLDLIYAGTEIHSSAELELPHPRLGIRTFVLQPLASIRPELILPGHALPVATLLENCFAAGGERLVIDAAAEDWCPLPKRGPQSE